MKLSLMGRVAMATLASLALGLGMTACGGGTIAFMWVLGDQYNQITGFKVDDYTGNLTQVPGSPFTSSGVNPVSIVVKPAGRFVYVINQGVGGTVTTKGSSSGISVYSVGNDGVLTFQQSYQSQGQIPVWAQFDNTGSYLYVLDKYSASGDGNGSITAYSSDSSTGRLTLVVNTQIKTTAFPAGIPYFEVGVAPKMMKSIAGCLLTLDTNDNSIFPYSFGGNGQLSLTTNGAIQITGAAQLTSLNGNGSSLYLTDANNGSLTANYIYTYTVGSGCSLTPQNGAKVQNIIGTANPVNSLVDNSGKYLYVLNATNTGNGTGTQAFSSISAFTINPSTQLLQAIAGAPYSVGSNPVCVVEDPTNQYLYISNRNDGTVSGKIIDSTTGELSDLSRGSTFPASGTGNCLAISGNVN